MLVHIREMIVVEGKTDQGRLAHVVHTFVAPTGGTSVTDAFIAGLAPFADRCGICIFTDPDRPGERIREKIAVHYPHARHARLHKDLCRSAEGHPGIAHAQPEAILHALELAGCHIEPKVTTLSINLLIELGLAGSGEAGIKRARLCRQLGLFPLNAKQLLRALETLHISEADLRSIAAFPHLQRSANA